MAAQRILLTGAGGFVGQHLALALRAAFPAADVVPTSVMPRGDIRSLDVTDADAVLRTVRELQPDACIHLAGIAAIRAARGDPDRAWAVNLTGTLRLARAVMAEAPACRFVFASSAEVYGRSFRAGRPLDETAVLAPGNTYAATKAAADLAIGALALERLDAVRLRLFNHTGPGQSPDFVVAAFARQVARIEAGLQPPVMQVGALDPFRDFLDVADVCAAYVAAIDATLPDPGTILNVASGTPRRIGDILEALCGLAGIAPRIETGSALLRPAEIPTASGDATRAREVLGWKPVTAWETTLRSVLDDWRNRVRRTPDAG
jgi:nucleoside-diphosphate-sugar epimerase